MSKPSAPSSDYQPPTNGPPSYSQALSEGAAPQPPPGPAEYKPPSQQATSYGGYGPPPGAAYPQYGPGPGMPQQQQQYGQYGPGPGMPHHQQQQQQQYGQYGAPPGLPVGGAPVVVQAPVVTVAGPNPCHMMCPHCHAEIDSSVRASPSTTAWIAGLLIALFGCWMGCCLIPCCMDECMDKEHYCPNCKAFLGSYRR